MKPTLGRKPPRLSLARAEQKLAENGGEKWQSMQFLASEEEKIMRQYSNRELPVSPCYSQVKSFFFFFFLLIL